MTSMFIFMAAIQGFIILLKIFNIHFNVDDDFSRKSIYGVIPIREG